MAQDRGAQAPARAGLALAGEGPAGASKSVLAAATIETLGLSSVHIREVLYNLQTATGLARGGQAQVYFATWRKHPEVDSGIIAPGDYVAIKHIRSNSGGGRFTLPQSPWELEVANQQSIRGQRIELHLLAQLHAGGCGARIVEPLAVFRWAGEWFDDPEKRATRWYEPVNGYILKGYPLGSVTKLLQNICYRRVPEGVGQRFLNLRTMSAEYAALLGELHKIHTKPAVRMMIQDLTPGNLLVDDGPEGIRLLLADPAMAQPIELLQEKGRRSALCGTWLWGSMRVRRHQFDPKADLYSLSFCFAEMWLVAEGAVETPADLIALLGADQDRTQGVQLMRRLVWEVLRLHHQRTISIKPRVQRHLPVSWLGAWLLLLGFRDFSCEQHMRQGLPCLRPSEEAMVQAAQVWARIAAAAEVLPPGLTEAEALSPACKAVVDDMAMLLQQLVALSHLDDAGEQEDPALAWCAANFMEQKHPLVAALRARGAQGVGQPQPPLAYRIETGDWWDAVKAAQRGARHATTRPDFVRLQRDFRDQLWEGEQAVRTLLDLGQWYQGLQLKMAEGTFPIGLFNQLLLPPGCHLALARAAEAATAPEQLAATEAAAQTAGATEAVGQAAPAAPPGPAAPAASLAPALKGAAAKAGELGGAASRLPQPATPGPGPVEQDGCGSHVDAGAVAFLDFLARNAASQPAVSGHKRQSSTVTAAPAGLHPRIASLLAAGEQDPEQFCLGAELQQLPAAEAALPHPGDNQPGLPPTAGGHTLLSPVIGALPAVLPPAGMPPLAVSLGATAPAAPPLPTRTQHMVPPGGPSLWPDLQGASPAAGAVRPPVAVAQPGVPPSFPAGLAGSVPPSSPAGCLPAAAPSPFSSSAGLARAAVAPGLSAATAGHSFPGGPAGAAAPGSTWSPSPCALPASGSLGAGALPGWPGGAMAQWAAQPAGGGGASGSQPHCPAGPDAASPGPLSAALWHHQPACPAVSNVQPAGGPPAIGQSPLPAAAPRAATAAMTQTSKKPRVNEQRTRAYAEALEQLLDLDRTPAPDDMFAPLQTREQVLAFLRWWAADGPQPGIPGMQFGNTHKSQYVLAVMDKATPGHGLTPHSRNGSWNERVTLVRQAVARVLCQLRQRWQNAGI